MVQQVDDCIIKFLDEARESAKLKRDIRRAAVALGVRTSNAFPPIDADPGRILTAKIMYTLLVSHSVCKFTSLLHPEEINSLVIRIETAFNKSILSQNLKKKVDEVYEKQKHSQKKKGHLEKVVRKKGMVLEMETKPVVKKM